MTNDFDKLPKYFYFLARGRSLRSLWSYSLLCWKC